MQPIERIVVVRPDAGMKNSIYYPQGNTVYIHPDSLDSFSCYGALYEAAFPQISEFWMRQGVGYLAKQFADVKENKDDFRNTIESFGDASMLSLFGVYYYDFVNHTAGAADSGFCSPLCERDLWSGRAVEMALRAGGFYNGM